MVVFKISHALLLHYIYFSFLQIKSANQPEAQMADAKVCPKFKGTMSQGRILKYNEYTSQSKYLYVFAPDEGSGPNLSRAFSRKPLSKDRKSLVAYCCEECGFVEFYGVATG